MWLLGLLGRGVATGQKQKTPHGGGLAGLAGRVVWGLVQWDCMACISLVVSASMSAWLFARWALDSWWASSASLIPVAAAMPSRILDASNWLKASPCLVTGPNARMKSAESVWTL